MRTTFSRLFTPKDADSHRREYGKLVRRQAFRPYQLHTVPSTAYTLLVTMTQHATHNTLRTQWAPGSGQAQHAITRGATGFGVGGMAVARSRHATSFVGL